MARALEVKVRRVLPGDMESKAVSAFGYVPGEIKKAGYVVTSDAPQSIPLFVTDEDLERAQARRNEKGRALDVVAESWGG
jgi:hypothetical protein